MTKRRVVITGLGGISPIGNTLEDILESLKTSKCGIDIIESFNIEDFQIKLAGQVKDLDPLEYLDRKSINRMDRVNILGLIAGIKSIEDSNINLDDIDKNRAGVYISSGIGGLETIEREKEKGMDKGYERISPFFIPILL